MSLDVAEGQLEVSEGCSKSSERSLRVLQGRGGVQHWQSLVAEDRGGAEVWLEDRIGGRGWFDVAEGQLEVAAGCSKRSERSLEGAGRSRRGAALAVRGGWRLWRG